MHMQWPYLTNIRVEQLKNWNTRPSFQYTKINDAFLKLFSQG